MAAEAGEIFAGPAEASAESAAAPAAESESDRATGGGAPDRARSVNYLAGGNRGVRSGSGDSASGNRSAFGIFGVIGLALVIGALLLITKGQVSQGSFFALLIFLIIGAIAPPVALIGGLAVVIGLLYQAGAPGKLGAWLGSVTQQQSQKAPGPTAWNPTPNGGTA